MSYINKITKQYPISEQDIKAANPNTSFTNPFVAPDPYALVFPAPQPSYDPISQFVRETTPVITVKGNYAQTWEVVSFSAEEIAARKAAALATNKAAFIARVDQEADTIYLSTIGERSTEYIQSEQAALAYKNGGYAGGAPADVHCWAVAKSQTDKWAADDILLAASKWRSAQTAIRSNRLLRKEQGKLAATLEALDVQIKAWSDFVVYITAQLSGS